MPAFDPYGGAMPFIPPSQPFRPPQHQAAPVPRQVAAPAPRPLVRAQAPEEPVPARPSLVHLPSPEALGLSQAKTVAPEAAGADWITARARLRTLDADCFQLQKLGDGRFYFLIFLPSASAGQAHRIEARADTEAEAVRLALDRAEQIRGQAMAAR